MTQRLFIKLLRDVRATWSRIVLMIVAMSVTLVVFSGVLYTRGTIGREILRGYLSTNPASATILFERGLDADEMAAIAAEARKQPGIIDSAPRTQFTLQIQEEGGGWGPNPLQIFVAAPNDPMQIENFTVEQGSWPPAAGEILIERSSLDLLNVEVGDTVVVKAPGGEPTPLRISGVAYYPALAPSFQQQTGYGFISAASLPGLGEPVTLDELKIQVADQPALTIPSRDRDVIVATARDLAGWLQQTYGVTIREVQVPPPYAHPHQRQANILLLALLVFGVAGLLLSAVLVATMLNGLFAQQIPQIGILKAIGARASTVRRIVVAEGVFMAVTSIVVAASPTLLLTAVMSAVLGNLFLYQFLPFRVSALAIVIWVVVVVLGAVLATLAPAYRASRLTVREALAYL